jgi:deoxyribodipyrimidine photo-lyase
MSPQSPNLPDGRWPAGAAPTRQAALKRLAAVRPSDYARSRNHIEGAVTGLSPYLSHGLLTLPEVLKGVLESGPLTVGHKLVYELGWREFFRHVWAHEGDSILESLHEGPLPKAAYARELPDDIRGASTGVPVIDQAVRTLYATGTLHNHARMWLASYVVHLRRVHWRAGADWMVAHLLDGDLASNNLSWQWVAGTGSHKPYLFNAENVAKYAPAPWHSPGTVVDRSYEELDLIAHGAPLPLAMQAKSFADAIAITEPALLTTPPAGLGLKTCDELDLAALAGRAVWLVHPWALRAPPVDLPLDAVIVGVYLGDYHASRPWPEARWRWVDAAMAPWAAQRYWLDAASLSAALAGAAQVRTMADPHLAPWLPECVITDPAPMLFPRVDRPCSSFSQWWSRATKNLSQAEELL